MSQRKKFEAWEKGILVGIVLGSILGPSMALLLVVAFFGYDLYKPTPEDVFMCANNITEKIKSIKKPNVKPEETENITPVPTKKQKKITAIDSDSDDTDFDF